MKNIFKNLKDKLIEDGEQEVDILFKKSTTSELEVITDLFKTYSTYNRIYSDDELDILKSYKLPSNIVKFYKENSPVDSIDIGADVYLLSLDHILKENSELAPGAYLIKYGVLTFASTTGGDGICMDLNNINDKEPSVIIADHSIFSSDKILRFKNGVMEKHDLTYEVIKKYAPEVSQSFTNFLNMIIKGEIDDIEDYLS